MFYLVSSIQATKIRKTLSNIKQISRMGRVAYQNKTFFATQLFGRTTNVLTMGKFGYVRGGYG